MFTAGQLPLTVDGDLLDDHSVPDQTRQCLRNVEAILAAEGLDREAILKTTVFLGDLDDFDAFNEAYGEFFGDLDAPPARSAVEVGAVPKGAALEIEAVAASD